MKKSLYILSMIILTSATIYGYLHFESKVDATNHVAKETYEENMKSKQLENYKTLRSFETGISSKDVSDIKTSMGASKLLDSLNDGNRVAVVFLGDSTTEQNKYTNGKAGHVEIIEDWISDVYPSNARIVNAGVSGDTSADMLKRTNDSVINQNPDLVVINSGINDASEGLSVDEFQSNLRSIIEKIKKESSAEIVLRTSNPTQIPNINKTLENEINPALYSLSKEYDTGFIDLYTYYSNTVSDYEKYSYDVIHPNEKGQKLIANFVIYSMLN